MFENYGKSLAFVGLITIPILSSSALPGGHMKSAFKRGSSRSSFGTNYGKILAAAVADFGSILECYLGGHYGERISHATRNVVETGRIAGKDILNFLDKSTNLAGIALNVVALGGFGR